MLNFRKQKREKKKQFSKIEREESQLGGFEKEEREDKILIKKRFLI